MMRPGSSQMLGPGASKAATAPTAFPELQSMSTEQLSDLLSDKDKFHALLDSYIQKSESLHVKRLLAKGNLDLAQANLDKEGQAAEVKNQIAIIRSSEYTPAKEAFDAAYKQQQEILAKIDSKALIAALGEKANQADEEAEELYSKFMDKETTVEAFVPAYTAKKKLYHQRELKSQAAQQIF